MPHKYLPADMQKCGSWTTNKTDNYRATIPAFATCFFNLRWTHFDDFQLTWENTSLTLFRSVVAEIKVRCKSIKNDWKSVQVWGFHSLNCINRFNYISIYLNCTWWNIVIWLSISCHNNNKAFLLKFTDSAPSIQHYICIECVNAEQTFNNILSPSNTFSWSYTR